MKNNESYVLDKLSNLELTSEHYVVAGSGVLDALGIRRANDVDFVTTPKTYEELSEKGWKKAESAPSLVKGDFEVYLAWDSKDGNPNFDDLMSDSVTIDGYNFVRLNRLLDWKKRVARPKDIKDIELIINWLKRERQ